jgi:hypothetical protein
LQRCDSRCERMHQSKTPSLLVECCLVKKGL